MIPLSFSTGISAGSTDVSDLENLTRTCCSCSCNAESYICTNLSTFISLPLRSSLYHLDLDPLYTSHCDVCDKIFPTNLSLKIHTLTNSYSFPIGITLSFYGTRCRLAPRPCMLCSFVSPTISLKSPNSLGSVPLIW